MRWGRTTTPTGRRWCTTALPAICVRPTAASASGGARPPSTAAPGRDAGTWNRTTAEAAAVDGGARTGRWNLEQNDGGSGRAIDPVLSLLDNHDAVASVGFPYFGGEHGSVLQRNVPVRHVTLADGSRACVATVYDLQMASYGVDRGLGGDNVAASYDDDVPYTPAWQEKHTTVPRHLVIQVAREFAQNAHDTQGKSMVIVGAALNHWYHMDMTYRGIINLLMMCGC